MSGYGPPPGTPVAPRPPASPIQRAAILAYSAGALGILSFIWGFLDWFTQGRGDLTSSASGYSINGAGSTAIVGISLIAGLLAAANAFEHKPVSLVPVVFGVSSLLLVFGVLIGKGGYDNGGGSSGPDIGMGVGMVLTLITVLLQVGVLVIGWLLASGRIPAPQPKMQGYPGGYGQLPYPGQQNQQYSPPLQPEYPGQPSQPGQYPPPPQTGYPSQQGPYAPPGNPYAPPHS